MIERTGASVNMHFCKTRHGREQKTYDHICMSHVKVSIYSIGFHTSHCKDFRCLSEYTTSSMRTIKKCYIINIECKTFKFSVLKRRKVQK